MFSLKKVKKRSQAFIIHTHKDYSSKGPARHTRIPEAETHIENVVFVIEKASFLACFGHLKGGVHDPCIMEPIYL